MAANTDRRSRESADLARRIVALETHLNELSERDDYPTNPEVVTLTEELDDLVMQYYRLQSSPD